MRLILALCCFFSHHAFAENPLHSGLLKSYLDNLNTPFGLPSHILSSPILDVHHRRLAEDDAAEKDADREDAISKLKMYLLAGLLMGCVVFFLQRTVHDSNNNSCFAQSLRSNFFFRWCCFTPRQADYSPVVTDEKGSAEDPPPPVPPSPTEREFSVGLLVACVLGLLVSYLAWGYFQEKLMTTAYTSVTSGEKSKFKEAEFLVFLNRLSGLIISSIAVRVNRPYSNFSPPYKFLFCSMSNILSAWFQYEALKFITFPMQVLAKSCKVLFTMLMGVAIDQKSFTTMEYANALMIALGLVVFKYGQESGGDTDDATNAKYFTIGLILIVGYICSDSFTSNWQSRIYKLHKITALQMMMGVNIFSCTFSFFTCAPAIPYCLEFLKEHPSMFFHSVLMSLCSGVGQLFIFFTIKTFGAVVFAVAMTSRLILSVLLSIVVFNHPVNALGFVGMFITFCALVIRVNMKRNAEKAKKAAKALAAANARNSIELGTTKAPLTKDVG